MTDHTDHYPDTLILMLEQMWGKGYLSPGGEDEVKRVLSGISLKDKRVLDIGCGSGGITAGLAKDFGAASVVGIDVESAVCSAARKTIVEHNLAAQVEIVQVKPGPIPFAENEFDIVFSKDSIVHIPDKRALAQDVYRLLKPSGWFVASDWLTDREGPPSEEMQTYLTLEDLGFGMSDPAGYSNALTKAGFEQIEFLNRGPWYCELAQQELERMQGVERSDFLQFLTPEELQDYIDTWIAMIVVLKSDELCPHHFRGQKIA